MTQSLIYLFPFSHLDLFWLGEREECLSRGNRVIHAVLQILREAPEFRFLLEDMVFADHFMSCHPESADELRAQVRAGRIEVCPKWTGIFQNLQTGEDLVRNLLYGAQFVREEYGIDASTMHLGDIPGYTPQYPQIAAKGGVTQVIITRGGPLDRVLYHWQAPDGSRVLVWNSLKGYTWARSAGLHQGVEEALKNRLDEQAREVMALTPSPILMHWGVDLIVPPMALVEQVREWNARTDLPMRFATATEYFQVAAETPDIPALEGEIPSLWPYTEPTLPHVCGLNTTASRALMMGENWSELSRRLGFRGLPAEHMARAWRKLLEGMDHNYRGTGARVSLRRKREYNVAAIMVGEEATREATRRIAESVTLPPVDNITPIVVFNSASWPRTEVTTAHASFHGELEAFCRSGRGPGDIFRTQRLYDAEGTEVPFQYLEQKTVITREATVCFTARDVPGHGYRLYYLRPVEEEPVVSPCCTVTDDDPTQPLVVESDRFRMEVSRPSGSVSLFDKAIGRPVASEMNLLAEEERLDQVWFRDQTTGRTFHNLVKGIEVVENGSVRAQVAIRGLLGTMQTLQQWFIYRDTDYVEVVDTITWQGSSPHVRAQRTIPTGLSAPQVVYGVPFGASAWDNLQPGIASLRGDELDPESWGRLRQVENWVDLGGPDYGVTIASNYRVIEREDGLLKLNLIRAGGPHDPFDDIAFGNSQFATRTRLNAHPGNWQEGRAYRAGLAVTLPLLGVSVNDPLSPKRLAPVASLCHVPADNILITTIKPAEDGKGSILRGYEVEGRDTDCTPEVVGAPGVFREVDLLEEGTQEVPRVHWQVHEIKTLRLDD